ncbi:MAG: SDR family oxidoreductase [Neisseria sp.]|uniref:SDR family oxidoreductase n=1 Tax=Neisseria sp. TaxID=192066 RepID=UPI0026DBAD33|nr:SDR family oxidoreductase [Neisseria sp.]MDO4640258.1 SDR family oxidoreductase [Neisseria sp.]
MNNIQDKVVIITGASSGLSESMACHLAEKGAKVVLAARRAERLNALVAEIITAKGGKALVVVADVAKQAEVQNIADQAIKAFGKIDVLINNAGVMLMAPLAKLRTDEWDTMIDVNVKGVLYGIAAVLPILQAQKSGQIINISSVAGLRVLAGIGSVYSGTKFAVKAISEGLRQEVAADNIRVTTIYPGAVDSELKLQSTDKESAAGIQAFYEANGIPADSIARAVTYAIEQPDDVAVNEITVRPTRQEF